MDDLISRQAAIDALDKEYRCTDQSDDWDGLKTAMLIIENLPSAQPDLSGYSDRLWHNAYERGKAEAQQRWIPCSERLPEHRLYVLVTYKYEYGLIDNGITWYSETENKWNTSR